jgi:hypothetical protein
VASEHTEVRQRPHEALPLACGRRSGTTSGLGQQRRHGRHQPERSNLRVRASEHRSNPVEAVEHDRSEAAVRCRCQVARSRQRQPRRIEPPVLGDLVQRRHTTRMQHVGGRP